MLIVHVSDCYPPRTGGIETQVRDLAAAQRAQGHEVHVLTATLDPVAEQHGGVRDDAGVQVHRLGTRLSAGLPVNLLAPSRVRVLLEELRPDVVHVHAGVVSPFAYDGARVARDVGAPVAVTWHCMLDGAVPALRTAVRRSRWASAPVALSAVSGAAADRVAEVFDGATVGLVPNGMDLTRWAPDADRPTDLPPLRCVATMRLARRKRGPALIGVVADALAQTGPGSLVLDLIGDGPGRRAVRRAVDGRGVADVVRLRGRLDRADVRVAYRGAHVFLAPARLEAFGIAALEARAAGLVVVAYRGTGIAEFVTDGVDGLLVDDDAAMTRALVRLVREPGLLPRLQGRARAQRPAQDWDHTLAAAEREYARARALRLG